MQLGDRTYLGDDAYLGAVDATNRIQLVTNPSVELTSDGWTGVGGSGVRSDAAARVGSHSFHVTATQDAAELGVRLTCLEPVDEGLTCTLSLYMHVDPDNSTTPTEGRFTFQDAGGAYATAAAELADQGDGWLRLSATHTVPAGRSLSEFQVSLTPADEVWQGGEAATYAWTGTPGGSTSTKSVDDQAVAHNLSYAGTFAAGDGGYLAAGWGSGATATFDTDVYRTGGRSLRVDATGGRAGAQGSAPTPSADTWDHPTIRAQAWVRTQEGATGTGAMLRLGGSGVTAKNSETVLTDGEWQLLTVETEVSASGPIVFYMYAAGTGPTWFDSVRLGESDDHGIFDGDTRTASADKVDTDAALIELGSKLGAYFDGDTPDRLDPDGWSMTYTWAGARHASTSRAASFLTRHLNLELVDTGIGAPAVGITVDGLDPNGPSNLRILRSTSGDAPTVVQGMGDLTATGAGYWVDYLPPLGREITYTAEVIEGEDPGRLSNTIAVESRQAWLQDALNPVIGCPIAIRPRRDEKIWFTTEAFATLERTLPAEAVQVIGARTPVMVRGRRQAPSSIPLDTITDAAEAGATLRSVLNESTHLVLRVPPSIRHVDPVLHLGDVQVSENPSRQAFLGGHLIRWQITGQQSRGPKVAAYTVLWTYDDVQALYNGMTYDSLIDARRYVDWLAHPDELGFGTGLTTRGAAGA